VASSRACGTFLNLGDRVSNARLLSGWLLLTVDIEEYLECVADCNEDVKEERLLRLSENLCVGEVGV
jgi:hypothetical protein